LLISVNPDFDFTARTALQGSIIIGTSSIFELQQQPAASKHTAARARIVPHPEF